jgi:hypothetical protein
LGGYGYREPVMKAQRFSLLVLPLCVVPLCAKSDTLEFVHTTLGLDVTNVAFGTALT